MKSFNTEQEVFDFVVGALIAQGRPAVTRDPSRPRGAVCRYRSADGAKCAGGHVIPDEIYTKGMEGQSIRTLINMGKHHPVLAALKPYDNLLIDLQNNHDSAALCRQTDGDDTEWLRRFKEGARRTAHAYNLVPTGLV